MVVHSSYRGKGPIDAINLQWLAGFGIPAVVDNSAVADASSKLPCKSLVESPVSGCTKLTTEILKKLT